MKAINATKAVIKSDIRKASGITKEGENKGENKNQIAKEGENKDVATSIQIASSLLAAFSLIY